MNDTALNVGRQLLSRLKHFGIDGYIVGGALRDVCLNEPYTDLDIVSSASIDDLRGIFSNATIIRTNIPLLFMNESNIRIEISELKGISLIDNLKKRDFTVNAMALDAKGEWIDPFKGRDDVERGVLRLVCDDAIQIDPLRILRAARMMAKYCFTADAQLVKASTTHRDRLEDMAPERIGEELTRLLVNRNAQYGLQWLSTHAILEILCPYTWPPDFSALTKVDMLVEKWVVFFFSVREKTPRLRLKKWRLSKRLVKDVERLFFYTKKRMAVRWNRWDLYEAGQATAVSAEKTAHALSDTVPGGFTDVLALISALPIRNPQDLAVSPLDISDHLNKTPGPWLGDMLRDLEMAVVVNQVKNKRGVLLRWAKERSDEI